MTKFTAHTAVHGDGGTVFFAPGDTVPDWAADKVGSHVTDASQPAQESPKQDEAVDAAEDATSAPTEDDNLAPDFTAKPARRGRPKRS